MEVPNFNQSAASAAGYPVLFMLGPEGFFGVLSPWGSVVGHCIVDLLSKNVSCCRQSNPFWQLEQGS
jgi:hypothetical protein